MKIPRNAPFWLKQIIQRMVDMGLQQPGAKTISHIDSWDVTLYWLHLPQYSVLLYQCEGTVDEKMQMDMLDAVEKCSKRNLVTIVDETQSSAFCFFGGAPDCVEIATMNFAKMDAAFK